MAYATVSGSAVAYDLYRQDSTARQPQQSRLPQDRPRAKAQAKARPQSVLLTAVELAAAAVVLLLVLFSQMKLYEVTSSVNVLQNQLAELQEEQILLRSAYDNAVDLAAIEEIAVNKLGMSRPAGGQTVYVNLSGTDRAEVLTKNGSHLFAGVTQTVREAFSNLGEYLS